MKPPLYYLAIKKFLNSIGIPIVEKTLPDDTFLPGIRLEHGSLAIDLSTLKYVGDMLHEAGHIACMAPSKRAITIANAGDDAGEEIASQAWSYAAALVADVPLDVLFHKDGYKGDAEWLRQHYQNGDLAGVPLLQWFGLTNMPPEPSQNSEPNTAYFPEMASWIRQHDDPSLIEQ
jgi:hypothetical protein